MGYSKDYKFDYSDDNLKRLKNKVEDYETFFGENKSRYSKFIDYVYRSTIDPQLRGMLQNIGMPIVEANILYPYVAKTAGEFLKNEPSVIVKKTENSDIDDEKLLMIGNYIRFKFDEANKAYIGYENFKLSLSGGFSVFEVCTRYKSPYSFQLEPFIEKVDPLMCGFDPTAEDKTKSTGDYCYKICYEKKDKFVKKYKNIDIASNGVNSFCGITPAPSNLKEKYVTYCEFYEKIYKKRKVLLLADKNTVTKKEYEKLKKYYIDNGILDPIPDVIDEKDEMFCEIIKYCLTDSKIFYAEKTKYDFLPLVFCDGDSAYLGNKFGAKEQFTRPFVMSAKGAQDFKNMSMVYWADNVTNRSRSKLLIAEDNIPANQGYLETILNPHKKGTIIVKDINKITQYHEPDTNSDVIQAYQMLDATIQSTIGGFGSNVGNSDLNLSGRAVVELNTMGNASSVPYFESMMASYNQIAIIIASLVTKLYVNESELTVIDENQETRNEKIPMGYFKIKHENINIAVSSSLNFDVQKRMAIEEIKGLMQASPAFADFINSSGLDVLVKNMSIYAKDELLQLIKNYEQSSQGKKQQQAEMQEQQQSMMMQEQQLKLQELQVEIQKKTAEIQLEMAKIQIEKERLELEKYEADLNANVKMSEQQNKRTLVEAQLIKETNQATQSKINQALDIEKHEVSKQNHLIDYAGKMMEIKSREGAQ